MTNATNAKHVDLCIALGGALGAAHIAAGSLQMAINAVRQAKVKFGPSARTCPYKLALRDAIVTGKTLTVSARDVLLSIVMKAVHSKSGLYIAAPSKSKAKSKGKNKGKGASEGNDANEGNDADENTGEEAPTRPLSAILMELMAHAEYARFCAFTLANAGGLDASIRAALKLKKAHLVSA